MLLAVLTGRVGEGVAVGRRVLVFVSMVSTGCCWLSLALLGFFVGGTVGVMAIFSFLNGLSWLRGIFLLARLAGVSGI